MTQIEPRAETARAGEPVIPGSTTPKLDAVLRLHELSIRLVDGADPASWYEQVLETAAEIMNADFASVQRVEPDGDAGEFLCLLAWRGFHPESARFWDRVETGSGSACGQAIARGDRVVVVDVERPPVALGERDLAEYRRSGIRAVQSTPLVSRSGRRVGMISTHWREPYEPSAESLRTFDLLARQVADWIERLENEERERTLLAHTANVEARFEALFRASPNAVAISKLPTGEIVMVNDAWLRLMGYERAEDVVGQTTFELGIHEDAEHRERLIAEFQRSGEVRNGEVRIRDREGRRSTLLVNLLPVEIQGERHILSSSLDITDRKLAEEALRDSEARLRIAVESASMFTWEMDVETLRMRWSENAAAVIGVEELPENARGAHFFAAPEERPRMEQEYRAAIAAGRDLYIGEFRGAGSGEDARWFVAHARVLYDDAGRPLRVIGVTQDITARHRADEQLREADRRKNEFLATLAHELRNPLAPIRAAAGILRSREHDDSQVEWIRDVIDRQVAQMARLLDDLLDLNRISRGKTELLRGRVELASVLESAIETSRPLLDGGRHELTLELPTAPVFLHADHVRLAQVFSNLLNNAAKYSDDGQPIRIAARRDGDMVEVAVEDRGVGISEADLPHVFEMFSQVNPSHGKGGLGIGLSLVKGLVEMHGGTVSASSDPGGSTFVVRLPLLPASDELETAESRLGAPRAARCRVLVVDDMPDNADSLAMLLEAMGHETAIAYGGRAGVAEAETWRPDVVILDLGMPEIDGYEACRRIREHPWGRDMVLIALTGWGQEEDRTRSERSGFHYHLVKPVDPRVIGDLLDLVGCRRTGVEAPEPRSGPLA